MYLKGKVERKQLRIFKMPVVVPVTPIGGGTNAARPQIGGVVAMKQKSIVPSRGIVRLIDARPSDVFCTAPEIGPKRGATPLVVADLGPGRTL